MASTLSEIQESEEQWLEVARINTDQQHLWVPEMMRYGVDYVPCFVMLNQNGDAFGKTNNPVSRDVAQHSLDTLLEFGRSAYTENK